MPTSRSWLRDRLLDERGVSLVEVLIAVMLLAGAFMALAQVATGGLLSLRSAADRTTAVGVATQTVESARASEWGALLLAEDAHGGICDELVEIDRDGSITEIALCSPDGAIGGGPPFWGEVGAFDVQTYVTAVPGYGNARRVTAIVTWEERGVPREVRTSTVVAEVARD